MKVTSAAVAAWRPLCEEMAAGIARQPLRSGVLPLDADDLAQEGMIAVWICLSRGNLPSREVLERRMLDYRNWHRRSKPIPYDQALPIASLLH